jgi:hypothetical protein
LRRKSRESLQRRKSLCPYRHKKGVQNMKFYPYKKACALLVTGALTTGAAVPALAAETKTAAPTTAEESKTKAMTLKEIQELVVKNNRLKTIRKRSSLVSVPLMTV